MIRSKTVIALTAASLAAMSLAGCEETTGSVHAGVYYDSMMWNDYYRPYPPARPNPPPGRPVHPIAPPPRPSPPIHRPTPRAR